MFLVKSRSDVQFGFEYPFFCVPDHASKIARLKNRAPKKRFAHKDVELLFIRMCFAYIAHEINIGLPLQSLFLFKQAHAMGIDRSHISRIIPNNSSFI